MFKFIHAADIHLDSPLLNLDHFEDAPVDYLRVATREAFDNLVRVAIDEQVAFLLIAGDLYDKDSPDFNTPRHVRDKFRELEHHGIRVYIIQGNHDATPIAKKAFDVLTFPENVVVFSTKQPETYTIDELHVALHGQGFATRRVEDDLASKYPSALPGYFNIGLLHTNLGGNASHDNYAPSTREGLSSKDYQYWALGHIHKRDEGDGGTQQLIHYPGNTQGRHFRELGPKGCTLVTVDDTRSISIKFRATDVWRWQHCEVEASGLESSEALIRQITSRLEESLSDADDRALAVRVTIKGQTTLHRPLVNNQDYFRQQLQQVAVDRFEDRVWLEKIKIRTQHPAGHTHQHRHEAYGELVAALYEVPRTAEVFADVRDEIEKALKLIPGDKRLDHLRLDLDDDLTASTLVEEACDLLTARLLNTPLVDQGGTV